MVNKVILVGNIGKDPEIIYTKDGKQITKFSLATTATFGDKKTSWHRVVSFGKLAEICGEYLKKGSMVYIEGRIEYGSYDKDGITRYTTDIIVEQMRMLGGKSEKQDNGYKPEHEQKIPTQNQPDDDDIPF